MIVVRSEAGRELVRGAMEAGYLEISPSSVQRVVISQKALVAKKGAVWGRLLVMRLMGLPVPTHAGYGMFSQWLRIPLPEMLRSTLGTARRILRRKYRSPEPRGPVGGFLPSLES
jgi:coenzyme F420 hydrogenase subunit beta